MAAEPQRVTTGSALEILREDPPAPPAGYASTEEVLEKVNAGEIPIINLLEPAVGIRIERDLEYGKVGDRSLKLDLYLPEQLNSAAPGIIFIHGGGWKGGDKGDYRVYGIKFAQKGYVVASISYRLSGEAKFPAAVEDAKCAVRWMRANAASLKVNPDRIGVAGGSAGGHLALMVGMSSDVAELEGTGGHAGVSSAVNCVVDLYGPSDLTTFFAQNLSREGGLLHQFLGKTYAEDEALYRQASPITYASAGDPPVLLLHGTVDSIVPIDQSDRLAKRLEELKVPYIYDRLPGWPHTMDLSQPVNDRCVWLMERFFGHYLKGDGFAAGTPQPSG